MKYDAGTTVMKTGDTPFDSSTTIIRLAEEGSSYNIFAARISC